MQHTKAVGIKLIIISIVVLSIFGIFYNISLGGLFLMSLLVTGIAYLIGDLFILSRFGNIVATISDFGLLFLSIWGLGNLWIEVSMPITLASLAAAYIITFTEPLFHQYMIERVLNVQEDTGDFRITNELQTEFAEETDAQTITEKNDENNIDK